MNIIRQLLDKFNKYRNPIVFWKKKGVTIGIDCEIYPSASFGSEPYLIRIGKHVRINSGVQFVNHDGGVWVCRGYINDPKAKDIDLFGKIVVGDNVHIGTNAIIMPGVTIGDNCIIGCGAIVTRDIPNNSIAAGIPARVIETIDEYINKNRDSFIYTKSLSITKKKDFLMELFNR